MPEVLPESAVPGSVVASGVLISPSGDQGPIGQTGPQGIQGIQGVNAYTVTTQDFVLPAVNLTATVTVQDASWVIPGQMVVVAGGYSLRCTGKTGNTLTLQNIGSPATAIPIVSPSGNGLMRMLPNTGQAYFRDDGNYALPGNYYGADTTNSVAYAVTVASDFVLNSGVVVWVTPSLTCAANPTLSVNGTAAKPIVNRANIALSSQDILANKTFGAMYDGTSWRVITPVNRWYNATNPANPTIECAGYDAVTVCAVYTSATGAGITLAHLGYGVPVTIDICNNTGAAMSYYVNGTGVAGTAFAGTYWIWANTLAGAAPVRFDSTATQSMTSATRFIAFGGVMEAYLFFK
jgi:hypothetical protein